MAGGRRRPENGFRQAGEMPHRCTGGRVCAILDDDRRQMPHHKYPRYRAPNLSLSSLNGPPASVWSHTSSFRLFHSDNSTAHVYREWRRLRRSWPGLDSHHPYNTGASVRSTCRSFSPKVSPAGCSRVVLRSCGLLARFDTAGEVSFAGISTLTNPVFGLVLSVNHTHFQTSPAVSDLVTSDRGHGASCRVPLCYPHWAHTGSADGPDLLVELK
jgi:hypothetical protein